MNKFLKKGFIQVFTGISLCFIGPVLVSQAFNNQDHTLFIVVLIIGVILLVGLDVPDLAEVTACEPDPLAEHASP